MATFGAYKNQRFRVIKGYNKKPFSLVIGSHTQNINGETVFFEKGDILTFESEARNGNVWFQTKYGRAKSQSGSILNMVKSGVIEKIDPFKHPKTGKEIKPQFGF